MGKPFSPSRALGIPAQDYDTYFPEDDVPAFNPDRGYSARPSMVTPTDAYRDQFSSFAADQGLQTLDAQKDMLNNGAEALLSPDGRNKRLDYMMKGVISPEQERTIEHFETAPRQQHLTKYSPVPVEVAKAASQLDYIDPTEPNALEKRNAILRAIDDHPEWGGSNLKTHPYFQDKDQKFLHNYYAHKHLSGTADHNAERSDLTEIHKALTSDVPTDALKPYLDPDMRRITDHSGFADVMAKAAHNKSVLTPKAKQKLLELQTAAEEAAVMEDNVPMKAAWLEAHEIDPHDATNAQWAQAYRAIRTEPMQAYRAFRDSLGLHDFSQGQQPAAPQPVAPQAAAPATQEGSVHVTTTEQYLALPKGTIYIALDGKPRRKN